MKTYKTKNKRLSSHFFKYQMIMQSFVIILCSILTSCNDFIDINAEDAIDAKSFYSNTNELIFGLNGVYALQRNIFGNLNYFLLIEGRSDNAGQDQKDQKERIETDTFEETPGNLLLRNIWNQNYILINNANTLIKKAQNVPFDNNSEKVLIDRAVGEAKFLRAISYYILVNMFGDLPLRVEPTENFNETTLERSSTVDVYQLIISDLTDAAKALPESYKGDVPFSEIGRVTRLAALTMLGKVHLQIGNKNDASNTLDKVMGNFTLLKNYSDLHAAANDNTAESIFEINFNPSNQTGLGLNNSFIPSSVAVSLGIVAGGYGGRLPVFPTNDVTEIYEKGDLRATASFATYDNNGSIESYISKYVDLGAKAAGSNINLVFLRYADVLLMKAEADGETDASYELINRVRRRGFGKDVNQADPETDIDASTPGTFLEKVMLERRREFIFENQRFFDLKRLPPAQALSIINKHLAAEYTGVKAVSEYQLLYPIPQVEIDVSNGIVKQNPGY